MTVIAQDALISDDAKIAEGVVIGPRGVMAGLGIVLRDHARLDAACVIAGQVINCSNLRGVSP